MNNIANIPAGLYRTNATSENGKYGFVQFMKSELYRRRRAPIGVLPLEDLFKRFLVKRMYARNSGNGVPNRELAHAAGVQDESSEEFEGR